MKIFLAIVAFLILSFFTYLGFYNTFYSPKITIQDEGDEVIVYNKVVGHYHLSDSVMKDVFNELYERNGIVITKGFGEYYHDPKEAGDNDIRFIAGCIVDNKDTSKLANISNELFIDKTMQRKYIVTDFPLKGRMSIMIGMYKVYPKLNRYCMENGYDPDQSVMEIYDRIEKKIHYRRVLKYIK